MKIYPHPSDGKPVLGAVVFPYRGFDISLSNLFGAGDIRVFNSDGGADVTESFIEYSRVPSANSLRDIVFTIDAHLDGDKDYDQ